MFVHRQLIYNMTFNQAIENIGNEQWDFLFKNSKRSSLLNGEEFNSLCHSSFKFVKETVPTLLKEGNFEKLIFECFIDRKIFIFENDIRFFDFNECIYFLFWIIDELKFWNEMEHKHLSSDPDFDMLAAGINDLNIFGDLNTTDSIAVKYGITPWEVECWSYQKVFDLQLKSKKESEFQKKYMKIVQNKNKIKNKPGL